MTLFQRFTRLALGMQLLIISLSIVGGYAAANSIASSGADDISNNININDLAPDECSHINLTNIVAEPSSSYRWNGITVYVYNGTDGNDLIIGSDAADDLLGEGGNDCLLAGDGLDYIWGGNGNDVLNGGGGADVCYGNAGSDKEYSCNDSARKAKASSADSEEDIPPDPEFTQRRP